MHRAILSMIVLFVILLAGEVFAQNQIDLPKDALGWQELSRIRDIPQFEVPALGALIENAQGPPVILWQDISTLHLKIPLLAAGRYTLQIAHLSGQDYPPLTVRIPQCVLGTTSNESEQTAVRISKFQTPLIPGQHLELTFESTQPNGKMGLLYIQPSICQYDPIQVNHWRTLASNYSVKETAHRYQINERGQIGYPDDMVRANAAKQHDERIELAADRTSLALTHFFIDTAFSDYAFELRANDDATVFVNGQPIITLKDGKRQDVGQIFWHKLNRGLNRIAVLMPASEHDQMTHWFEFRSSAANQISFYSQIPHAIDFRDANTDWPRVNLSNSQVQAQLPLPDQTKGFYRSVRFEAAGQITALTANNHQVFTSHLRDHQPLRVDAAAGTASEFLEPQGFDEATPGQTFMKVGVGLLRRPLDHEYFIGSAYVPVRFFDWHTQVSPDAIKFTQDGDSPKGYAYHYEKRIKLTDNPPGLVIEHQLINTGRRRILTSHYNHNFIAIDREPIDMHYQLDFAFTPQLARDVRSRLQLHGKRATPLGKGTIFTEIFGFAEAADSMVVVHHQPSNVKLSIRLDQPMVRFWLYASDRVLCPEMFIQIDLSPGQRKRWISTYEIQ